MLIGDYQGRFIGWEMVAIAHKLTLTGFLALYRPGTVAQIFVACVVGLTIGAVQTLASPYRTPSDNYFAFFTSCMLQLVFQQIQRCICICCYHWDSMSSNQERHIVSMEPAPLLPCTRQQNTLYTHLSDLSIRPGIHNHYDLYYQWKLWTRG